MQAVVLATGNKGKVAELSELLAPLQLKVQAQSDFQVPEVAETGTTFVENAIIKARHASKITGLPAIADDSGLSVDALDGAPGLYSSRYAGVDASDQDNIELLLNQMRNCNQREASFHCVLVYMRHHLDPAPLICHGQWQGEVSTDIHGAGGFGYDPVFWVNELNCSAAQLSKAEKNQHSHRGQALRALIKKIEACK